MYSRSQNDNGTYNSRCLYCFLTIASAVEAEDQLDPLEARHICPERALAELQREKTADAAKAPTATPTQARPN